MTNSCFDLLDRAVIDGRADDLLLSDPPTSHARLLEDVAAVAGVLRAVEVAPGHEVVVEVADDAVAVVVLLAILRLGARPTSGEAAVAVRDRDGVAHLVWLGDRELDWAGVLKAGRTDPAPASADAAPGAPDLTGLTTPVSASELRGRLTP